MNPFSPEKHILKTLSQNQLKLELELLEAESLHSLDQSNNQMIEEKSEQNLQAAQELSLPASCSNRPQVKERGKIMKKRANIAEIGQYLAQHGFENLLDRVKDWAVKYDKTDKTIIKYIFANFDAIFEKNIQGIQHILAEQAVRLESLYHKAEASGDIKTAILCMREVRDIHGLTKPLIQMQVNNWTAPEKLEEEVDFSKWSISEIEEYIAARELMQKLEAKNAVKRFDDITDIDAGITIDSDNDGETSSIIDDQIDNGTSNDLFERE